MTRKCALCKETNNKNSYSFFSVPKDPETRKKWQVALAIEDYAIMGEMFVCGKHFHKNDIITHWVSGVPPLEIKIKYKKCRLRRGAVPSRNFQLTGNLLMADQDNSNKSDVNFNDSLAFENKRVSDLSVDNETFLIPRRRKILSDNEYADNKDADVRYQSYSRLRDGVYKCEKNYESDDICLSEDTYKGSMDSKSENSRCEKKEDKIFGHDSDNRDLIAFVESVNIVKEEIQIADESSVGTMNKTIEHSAERYDSSEEDKTSMEIWEHDVTSTNSYLKNKSVNNLETINNLYINNRVLTALNYVNPNARSKSEYVDADEKEILFEDFLEMCTEVPVPRGWSCLVTSKGYGTTVVYLYMNITMNGLPFVEKQVFLRRDMILHCAAANKEIDPLAHNLVKEEKRIKVTSLLNIEELVDEFDRRVVCQGICDSRCSEQINIAKIAYKDGIKWRHTSCPLIMNSDLSRCTKCAALFCTLMHKSFKLLPSNSTKIAEERKSYASRQIQKRRKIQSSVREHEDT